MPKLRPLSGHEVCRILEKHGFKKVRQSGSHLILRKQLPARGITVPVPNHSEIAKAPSRALSVRAKFPNRNLQASSNTQLNPNNLPP